ncbi:Uncharacterised protein [Chromobacterium violaceum]|uniref:N-acetyltransferase domain-containing protein n=1 Tax=Chromobacterium violaceum TaxID=536 RepID=A0A3S4HQC6_CHRVL|nr:Uncharacterised protein [Chromobacterium violaceum]
MRVRRAGRAAVFAKVRPANLPSIRVLLRLGFRHHGSLRDIPAAPASLVYALRAPTAGNADANEKPAGGGFEICLAARHTARLIQNSIYAF